MAKEIKEYLESKDRDYDVGLIMLSRLSKNRILIANLGRKKNAKKLEYELGKFNAREQRIIEGAKAAKAEKTRTSKIKKLFPKDEAEAKALLDLVTEEELKDLAWKTQLQPLRKLITGEGKTKAEIIAALIKFKTAAVPETPPAEKKELKQEQTSTDLDPEEDQPGVARVRIIKGTDQKVKFTDLPIELQERWTANTAAYTEKRSLFEKLKLMTDASDEERAKPLKRIDILADLIRANWDIIDAHYLKVNKEPAPGPAPKKIDNKRISSNRKFISTNLAKLERSPRNFNLKAKIQLRIDELITAEENFKPGYIKKLEAVGLRTTPEPQ